MIRVVLIAGLSLLLGGLPRSVEAARFALLAASNEGWATELPLRFAERDAQRLATTLTELGQFRRENVELVTSARPASIERAVAAIGRRIASAPPGKHLLLLYYSGHAGEDGIHPGRDRLSYARLKQLLAQIPAAVRVTLIDSCHSGQITRLKGRPGPAFDVKVSAAAGDNVEGDVFITSSSPQESAQESDRLGGSFFTTHVIAALRGAADVNRDGRVTLAEMYTYAYGRTVGSTSATPVGAQHPAHRFDLRGKGEVVISYPLRAKACLLFPRQRRPTRYLVLHDGGRVIAEVSSSSEAPVRLAVMPGDVMIRRRSADGIYEQRLPLLAQECRQIRPDQMREVLLPHTLSKGELLAKTWSVSLDYAASFGFPGNGARIAHGATLALRVPLGHWALRPQLYYGAAKVAGEFLEGNEDRWGIGLAFTREVPLPWGLVAFGPLGDYQVTYHRVAPLDARWLSGVRLGGLARWSLPLPIWRLRFGLEARAGYRLNGLGGDLAHSAFLGFGAGFGAWW
jgi:hypothetical protein